MVPIQFTLWFTYLNSREYGSNQTFNAVNAVSAVCNKVEGMAKFGMGIPLFWPVVFVWIASASCYGWDADVGEVKMSFMHWKPGNVVARASEVALDYFPFI